MIAVTAQSTSRPFAPDPGYSPARLPRDVVKQLSQRSSWRAFGIIVFEWVLIALAIALSEWAGSYWVTALCVIFIATRQHALLIMMHDACHYLLSPNKTLNDLMACVFCVFPFMVSMKRYRANHLAHHRLINGDNDPDLGDNDHPKTKAELYRLLLTDLLFLSVPKQLRRSRKFGVLGIFLTENGPSWHTERVLFLTMAFVAGCAFTWTGTWGKFALYWMLPFFSILQAILHFRGFSEHAGRFEETDVMKMSRTIDVGFAERVLFAPCHVNRHLEHHLYPSIPCYNLERVHELIAETPEYRAKVTATNGYLSLSRRRLSVFGELYQQEQLKAAPAATGA